MQKESQHDTKTEFVEDLTNYFLAISKQEADYIARNLVDKWV